MRTNRELLAYLNDYFAPEVWRAAKDVIGNNVVSETHRSIRESGQGVGITGSRLAFDTPPGFTERNGTVTLALPAQGFHNFETTIVTLSGFPNADATVELGLRAALSGSPNVPTVTVIPHVNINAWYLFLVPVVGPIILAILNRVFADAAEKRLQSQVVGNLGGITSYRFDRKVNPAWDGPNQIVLSDSRAVPASPDPRATGYVDIVLVADGYTAATIGEARDIATVVEGTFHGVGAPLANAYERVKTGFRFWLMPLVAADPADARGRITLPVPLPGSTTVNFANLARLAEIGLSTRQFFGRDPMLVILSRVSAVDRANAAVGAGDHIRANAQGPFVQLPTQPFPDLLTAPAPPVGTPQYHMATLSYRNDLAALTQHELGHTPLGRYLADEYDDNGGGVKEYFGPEPAAANVTTSRVNALVKWGFWVSQQPAPYSPVEGAYAHDTGAFRFQADCNMRADTTKDFCPVCQEQLLRGLLVHGHFNAPTLGVVGMVQLCITYREPFVSTRNFPISGGAAASAPIFHHGQFTATVCTRVELSVVAASVPEPWEVVWDVHSPGSNLFNQRFTGSSVPTGTPLTVDLAPGARVAVSVTHRPDPTVIGPFFPVTVATGALTFDAVVQPALTDLQPPTALTQSVPVGDVLRPTLDPATGALTYPSLILGATSGAISQFTLPVGTDFSVYAAGANGVQVDSIRYPDRRPRWPVSWVVNRRAIGRPTRLPLGQYRWRARSFWQRLEGGWVEAATDARTVSFEVSPPAFDEAPGPPAVPFDLQVIPSLFQSSRSDQVQATSYHPNNRAFRFEFEIKERTIPFDGAGTVRTALRQWDSRNTATVALTDSVPIPPPGRLEIIGYHWRVKAIGDDNRESAWVSGPDFDFIPIPEKPRNPARWRDTLSRIDPKLLLGKITGPHVPVDGPPRGPQILLRLTPEPLPETDILKNLGSRGRGSRGGAGAAGTGEEAQAEATEKMHDKTAEGREKDK